MYGPPEGIGRRRRGVEKVVAPAVIPLIWLGAVTIRARGGPRAGAVHPVHKYLSAFVSAY